jgi:hypothetical protein
MNRIVSFNCDKPCLIGGDFNLVRSQKDKSYGNVNWKWCDKFNEWVDRHSLIESGYWVELSLGLITKIKLLWQT